MDPFISTPQAITFPGFSGELLWAQFQPAAYHDDLFRQRGVAFPAALGSAVAKRRAEYLAGRVLAGELLAAQGYAGFELKTDADRAPCWPMGMQGSLSHSGSLVLCALRHAVESGGVGVDVEAILSQQQAADLWRGIVSSEERDFLATGEAGFPWMLTLAFSAKESLFKALFPQVRQWFDFLDARLEEVTPQGAFQLRLLKDLSPPFPAGRVFTGCYRMLQGSLVTLIDVVE